MTQTATEAIQGTTTATPPTSPQRAGPSWVRIFVSGLVL